MYKILTGKERVDSQSFFQLATDSHNLRGHNLKLFLPQGAWQLFERRFSVQELLVTGTLCHNTWSKLQQWIPSTIDWTSTGRIWAFKAQVASSSTSSIKYQVKLAQGSMPDVQDSCARFVFKLHKRVSRVLLLVLSSLRYCQPLTVTVIVTVKQASPNLG